MGLLVGGNELARFIRARQQLNDYAAMVAYDIAGAATDVPIQRLGEMIRRFGLVAPELIDPTQDAWPAGGRSYFSVGISMVEMVVIPGTCNSGSSVRTLDNCRYRAEVRWWFGSQQRPCQELTDRGSAAASLATLPTGAFQANAVVLVDVSVNYKPIFQSGFKVGGIDLAALNRSLTRTFTAESWQTVRNWRNSGQTAGQFTNYPKLVGASTGVWDGANCPIPGSSP